ncbi:hypothetical protein BHM03_00026810 [Ensete ventricosum]|nr:hypothetical protein BHM03_00026810 [Ensete ventricosum]
MSPERSTPINPGEDAPSATQPTSRGAYQPPPPFSDGNIHSHTQGRYWSLLNDPGLTPPLLNLRTPVVTPEAFQGLTNQAFMIGIMPSRLFSSLVERPPITIPEILQRANQYVSAETLVEEKCKDQKCPRGEPSRCPPSRLSRRRVERDKQTMPRPPNVSLNSTRTEIFLQIREKGLLKNPNPLRSRDKDRDRRRYYRFHCDYRHNTKECYDLKNLIKDLIHYGHLDRYIRKPHKPSLRLKGSVEQHIDVIVGSPTAGGVSSLARKAYARAEVQKRPRLRGDPGFTFESESEYPDHNDDLVVMAHIANACIKRIMIDTGSSADILYIP